MSAKANKPATRGGKAMSGNHTATSRAHTANGRHTTMSDAHDNDGASIDPRGTSVRDAGRLPRPLLPLVALVAVALLALPATACASGGFGIERVEVRAEEENGAPATQAGSHPYALTVTFALDRKPLSQAQKEAGLGDAGPLGEEIAEG